MVIVTGATGLLGSVIVRRLHKEKISVVALKRINSDTSTLQDITNDIRWIDSDILDLTGLNEEFKKADLVIHCAAHVSFDPREEETLLKVNIEGTKNIVNACLTHGVSKLIHISSVAALGRQKGITTIDETATWVDSPLNSAYAKSKYLAELEVYRGIEEGLSATIVCPSFILAPSNWDKSSSQIFQYIWKENKFFSNGISNYVDVADVAELVYQLYHKNIFGERFIACAGNISFENLFGEIARRFNKKSPSIKVAPFLLSIFARLEEIRCLLLRTKPLITRESIKATRENFVYSNKKSVSQLQMQYKTLQETLDRCCRFFLEIYSIKK